MSWPGGDDEHIDDRERRVIRNEALFREVNERIEDVSEDVSRANFIEFLCECGEELCVERIELTREEYEQIRSVSDFERVIDRRDRYVVIDKVGQAEQVAERTDPRT
jgi:hypothetical protein